MGLFSPTAAMVKHNNILPNQHFRKEWDLRVKTWFDQPGRKARRRNTRKAKAAAIAPNPVHALRPAVRAPTFKYHTKLRAGRGFTLDELKAAGVQRKNRSQESLDLNAQRLKEYMSKIIVFPRVAGKAKKGDSKDANALKNAVQNTQRHGLALP